MGVVFIMVRQISSIPLERQAFLIVLFSYIACPTHPALCAPPQRPHQAYPIHPCRLQQPHIRLPAGENVCDVRQQHKARVRQLPIYPSNQSSVVTPPQGSLLSSPFFFPPPPPHPRIWFRRIGVSKEPDNCWRSTNAS